MYVCKRVAVTALLYGVCYSWVSVINFVVVVGWGGRCGIYIYMSFFDDEGLAFG